MSTFTLPLFFSVINPIDQMVIASDPLLITVRTKVSVGGGEGCCSVCASSAGTPAGLCHAPGSVAGDAGSSPLWEDRVV
jgi:hypothetical protein